MNQKKKGPVAPIYTIGIVWLLYSLLIHPISTIGHLIGVGVLGVIGYSIARVIAGSRKQGETAQQTAQDPARNVQTPQTAAQATIERQKAEAQAKAEAEKRAAEAAKPKYPPEVQAVVDEGAKAHTELTRLYASIPNLSVKRKVQELIEVSDKIIADAVADPSDVPQIKKFLDYYLPTTIKLLNSYDRMGQQGIEGENITGTMQSIEEMLDTAVEAYKKLLDSLFANQAMDVETDIQVMNTLLQREGFNNPGSQFSEFSRTAGQTGQAGQTMGGT